MKKSHLTGKRFNLATLGDVHLGHPRTSTKKIVDVILEAFPGNRETADLDMILINGDFFDRNLSLSSDVVTDIHLAVCHLLRICADNNIILRVLEGTPSHDYRQSQLFEVLNDKLQLKANVRHVTKLEIEYFPEHQLNILFVPDEWHTDPDKTWLDVKKALSDHQLKTVDYVSMHGNFEYQLPEHVPASKHILSRYESITNKYILINHIHRFSKKGKAIAPGSLERLAHNEEEAKGHIRIYVEDDQPDRVVFVENKKATPYVTLDCTRMSPEEIELKIRQVAEEYSKLNYPGRYDAHVRVFVKQDSPFINNFKDAIALYDRVRWEYKLDTDKKQTDTVMVDTFKKYVAVQITPENVHSLLRAELSARGHSSEFIEECLKLVK